LKPFVDVGGAADEERRNEPAGCELPKGDYRNQQYDLCANNRRARFMLQELSPGVERSHGGPTPLL
jgi:hypothetical protein